MTITQRSVSDTTVLDISGRFEFTARKAFASALEKAQERAGGHIILNFQAVPFLDSAALSLLALAHQNMKLKNGRLSIANPQTYVHKVLELANFQKFIPIYQSVDEAASSPAMA